MMSKDSRDTEKSRDTENIIFVKGLAWGYISVTVVQFIFYYLLIILDPGNTINSTYIIGVTFFAIAFAILVLESFHHAIKK